MNKIFQTLAYYMHFRRLYGRLFGPRVLVVSVPKSGTHLLLRTLTLFPQLRIGKVNIEQAKRGHILQGHYPPDPALLTSLQSLKFKLLFIMRDPRSTCLSFYHWAARNAEGNEYHDYFAALPDNDARLNAAISGMKVGENYERPIWSGINREVRKMLPWIDYPDCLTIAFEDLVGEAGGGDDETQKRRIQEISRHLNVKLTDSDVNHIASNLFGRTRTFRKGKIDEWRDVFQPHHIELLKREAGDLLIELGYEQDFNW